MKHEPLFDAIKNAFPPTPIVAAGAFEERGITYCDGPEYMRQMDGKTWEDLDPQFFARRSDGLSFLGTAHLVAVLPQYLLLLLVFEPTSPVPETLLPLLTKPEPTGPRAHLFDWSKARFDSLTRTLSDLQKATVAAALRRFTALYPNYGDEAQPALDRYWSAFES